MTGILTQKDIFNTIYKTPNFFSEFYGDNFSSNFKEVYERINQSRLESLIDNLKLLLIPIHWFYQEQVLGFGLF